MKRYIYTGAGTLVVAGVITAVLLGGMNSEPEPKATIYGNQSSSQNALPSASPTGEENPEKKEKAEETPKETTPVGPNVGENNTSLIDDGQEYDYTSPVQGSIELAPPQEMRQREDGGIYFVNPLTGEEIKTPAAGSPNGAPIAPGSGVAPVGKGSDADKLKIAETYRDYLNALYNEDYEKACTHVNIPAGMGMGDCMAKLTEWNSMFPITSEYSVDQYKLTDIQGNNADVSPWVVKDSSGNKAVKITFSKSASNPSVWLISEKVITQV